MWQTEAVHDTTIGRKPHHRRFTYHRGDAGRLSRALEEVVTGCNRGFALCGRSGGVVVCCGGDHLSGELQHNSRLHKCHCPIRQSSLTHWVAIFQSDPIPHLVWRVVLSSPRTGNARRVACRTGTNPAAFCTENQRTILRNPGSTPKYTRTTKPQQHQILR